MHNFMVKVTSEEELRLFTLTLYFLGYTTKFNIDIEINFLNNGTKDNVYMLIFTKINQFNLDELVSFEEEDLEFIMMPSSYLLNCKNMTELHSFEG